MHHLFLHVCPVCTSYSTSDLQTLQADMLLHGEGGGYKPNPQENQDFPWVTLTE